MLKLKNKRVVFFLSLLGEIPLFILLSKWTYILFKSAGNVPSESLFIDNANLAIHEGGHLIFSFLGSPWNIMGGTIVQLLIPLVIIFVFLFKSQYFSAGFALFWLGENLTNVSVYIKDARTTSLPLLGGSGAIHDWNYILNKTYLLEQDTQIALWVYIVSLILMSAALLWMGVIIVRTLRELLGL